MPRRWPPVIPCADCGAEAEPFTVEVEDERTTQVLMCPNCGMVDDDLMQKGVPVDGWEDPF
jgi:uncharacterized Zn finger protein